MKTLASKSVRETQPVIHRPLAPEFVVLYGDDVIDQSTRFFKTELGGTSLDVRYIEASQYSGKALIDRLAREMASNVHMLLNIHGAVATSNAPASRMQNRHRVRFGSKSDAYDTEKLLEKIVANLSDSARSANAIGRPFIYLPACESGSLRHVINPSSPVWKKVNLLLLSGSKAICFDSIETTLRVIFRYVEYCRSTRQAPDPLKLLYIAGLRRGQCLTLMGGDLEAALVWHAPRSEDDLSDVVSLTKLSGRPADLERFRNSIVSLSECERALLPPASLAELLVNRIERNDAPAVRRLIADHPDLLKTRGISSASPLAFAIEFGALQCLIELLKAGQDPNEMCSEHHTPMTYLALYSHVPETLLKKFFNCLIDFGADPNRLALSDIHPLMAATFGGHVQIMRFLIDNGAHIGACDADEITCLEYAATENMLDPLRLLLEYCPDEAAGLTQALVAETRQLGHHEAADLLERALQERAVSVSVAETP